MESLALIIFGITSNLAQTKLVPALYDMEEKDLLPPQTKIIGISRHFKDIEELRSYLHHALHFISGRHKDKIREDVFDKFQARFHYLPGDFNNPAVFFKLKEVLDSQNLARRIFYLATYPSLYKTIFEQLQRSGLNKQTKKHWVRLMIEKPLGHDLRSAKELGNLLKNYFTDDQIYRLDHYLAKETMQNILTFRFGNGLFEPLMTNKYVDHIQIIAAETTGINQRGKYYDSVGALKDVGQNHLLQMLTLVTMDSPAQFSNRAVTDERIKILQALKPMPNKIVFGQYEGYIQEENVDSDSTTDTLFALKTEIDNDRLRGVPIYIRGGKMLAQNVAEIVVIFKVPHHRLFRHLEKGLIPNVLIYRIQPNEGIVVGILVKKPGSKVALEEAFMQFCYRQLETEIPDAYEHLIAHVIEGDQTFFNDAAEVEAQWQFIQPLTMTKNKPVIYQPGSWGPKQVDELISADGRSWIEPSMAFCSL